MTKLLLILGLLGCVLLLGATAVLVRLNWSDRLLTPLFSILLGGTATTFITVTALLNETNIEKTAAFLERGSASRSISELQDTRFNF